GTNSTGDDFANFKKISISGKKVTDITGNGITADDTPLAGVTIHLFSAVTFLKDTLTAADGSYSFTDLGPASYTVEEVRPSGYVQAVGVGPTTLTSARGTNVSGDNFANYQLVSLGDYV